MIHDPAAERAVAGVVLNTRHGVGRVALRPEDFYDLGLGRLYAAALAMGDVVGLEERVAFAVDFADVAEGEVQRLISESPVMFDASEWAASVVDCAKRRAAMGACVAAYEALRDGVAVDEAMVGLR